MSSLIKPEEELEVYVCTDALDDYGYVLMLKNTGQVAKCTANSRAFGINYKSTVNPITNVAEANKKVAVVKSGTVWVQYNLATTDTTINIGDLVSCKGANAAGCVKKHTFSSGTTVEHTTTILEIQQVVGTALESVTPPSSGSKTGKMKVLLHPGSLGRSVT